MNRLPFHREPVAAAVSGIADRLRDAGISRVSLVAAALELRCWAQAHTFDRSEFAPATAKSKEVLYELAHDQRGEAHLYIVSDAPGVVSPPHEHGTWAIIVGLEGVEDNTLYQLSSANVAREVAPLSRISIGRSDVLTMLPNEIHATASVGSVATYHLHLYGRRLASLPPFEQRTFRVLG